MLAAMWHSLKWLHGAFYRTLGDAGRLCLSVADLLYQQEVYRYCVFFCHLALEKRLKALVMEHAGVAEPREYTT